MRKTTQKLASLLFILLGFTPLLFILVVSVKKQEIRHRMKEELEKGQLQTVIVAEHEVVWMDEHEIWVNNSMFDIQTKELVNGIYTFTGLYDEAETLLVMQERDAAGEVPEEDTLISQLFKCLPEFCGQNKDNFAPVSLRDLYRSDRTTPLLSPFREILTPPPQS